MKALEDRMVLRSSPVKKKIALVQLAKHREPRLLVTGQTSLSSVTASRWSRSRCSCSTRRRQRVEIGVVRGGSNDALVVFLLMARHRRPLLAPDTSAHLGRRSSALDGRPGRSHCDPSSDVLRPAHFCRPVRDVRRALHALYHHLDAVAITRRGDSSSGQGRR